MASRILFVTGKGGTGKSWLVSRLAREAASRGERVLVIRTAEVGGATESQTDSASDNIEERFLDETTDLGDFLARVLGLSFFARRLQDSSTFNAVAAAAPGLRDLVALAAIASEARSRRGLVLVDAPASGHALPMLTAPARVLDLASFGPVAREAERARKLIGDANAFEVVLVTTPEELSISEVVTLREQLAAAGIPVARVVVNALWPSYVEPEDGERAAAASPDAALHWRRHCLQTALVTSLEARIGPCAHVAFELPEDPAGDGGVDGKAASDVAALFDALRGATP